MAEIRLKRIYEAPANNDGFRVLVDRVWPRGMSREDAHIDLWLKDIAPSTGLRKWFAHDVAKWPEFQKRYRQELKLQEEALRGLHARAGKRPLTLLYGARDEKHNQAVVLKRVLEVLG
ncbi:MAG: Hypothetical protein BHV28_01800 [Candidatus Tokpelaia hoelldobleri]|uniref:Uroporphyrin-III C-methyltransferase n=1 Tax=Candidatus Tokpelaia hoelldobleri TaxID=1902579 RepID=A0A1U9JSQ6_9HYPH|nr:MAG: Hypothetical protein BHV28_01800 [Candidatus Tokpelaia hoelldoblerii]